MKYLAIRHTPDEHGNIFAGEGDDRDRLEVKTRQHLKDNTIIHIIDRTESYTVVSVITMDGIFRLHTNETAGSSVQIHHAGNL